MKRLWTFLGVVVGAAIVGQAFQHDRCEMAWLEYGLTIGTCPVGTIRQTAHIDVSGMRRGAEAMVRFGATAHYTTGEADAVQTAHVSRFDSIELSLLDSKNAATPLTVESWEPGATFQLGRVKLPEVADGDYKLHAKYKTRLGAGELDVNVPLYTPARIHVITDRPLYEPGNVVKFRAVVLRARDLSPLDGRPGRWMIKDPNGEVLLEEKAPAGDWGVVAGTFPLDKAAQTGSWRVSWVSADATDEVPFTVQPFKLPRFRVDAATAKPFYMASDTPTIKGAVIYSSGAPVANANLDITWELSGDWPPPPEWEEKLLPKKAVTAANGRFELVLPQVPADLQGQVTMTAHLAAVDPAGDRVESVTSVLLSQDGIQATAVTELGDGLVEGFNNRMYVRVTTPDGRVVSKAKIKVKRAWQANDNGIDAELDEDGVASLQIDPGAPVNITIPARPFRAPPRPPLVTRDEPEELIAAEGASLADQVEIDKWLAPLAACGKWADSDGVGATVGVRVGAGGAVIAVGAGGTRLDRCVAGIVRQRRLPAGAERLYAMTFSFGDPDLPKLAAAVEAALALPEGLEAEIQALAQSTRDCLPITAEGALPRTLTWRTQAGSKTVELGGWVDDPKGGPAGAALACVTSRFSGRVELAEKTPKDSLGLIRFSVEPPARMSAERPQATTMLGYELTVLTDAAGSKVPASTKLRVVPGVIPDLRMRVSPVLAAAGDTVTAELIRGPSFTGQLPKELEITHLKATEKQPLDAEHKVKFTVKPGLDGWFEIAGGGTRALVYVKPLTDLAVSVEPKQSRYKPGEKAELVLQTRVGGKGSPAAVSLIGVDESLGQLAALPGADSMGRVQPKVETATPAFGVLDGQALTLGRIRGANAAAATVIRVSSTPTPPELDAVVNASAQSQFDPIEELTDRFYVVLAELHVQARRWEASAPQTEKMRPATMSELWTKALAAVEKRGERTDDAYGRRLRLSLLPIDLLSLTDPRAVIVVGTRLPEDVENWAAWVARERP